MQKKLACPCLSVYDLVCPMCVIATPIRRRFAGACPRARRGAFSLIELIVVIAMIGILVMMLVPSLRRSVQLAASTVCMHNLREIGYGLQMYRIENDGWLPQREAADFADVDEGEPPWFVMLWPAYMGNLQVMTCPEDPFRARMPQSPSSGAKLNDMGQLASYGINSFMLSAGDGRLANLDRYAPRRPLDTILVADMGPDVRSSEASNSPTDGPARNASLLWWDDGVDPLDDGSAGPWLTARHGTGINVLTIGGAVREAATRRAMTDPLLSFYDDCAAAGCTLCNYLDLPHYSFAADRLYWWTGPPPAE